MPEHEAAMLNTGWKMGNTGAAYGWRWEGATKEKRGPGGGSGMGRSVSVGVDIRKKLLVTKSSPPSGGLRKRTGGLCRRRLDGTLPVSY